MAKKVYVGIDGKARQVKQIYIGIGGLARKVKKAYVGVGGIARPFWGLGGQVLYYGEIESLSQAKNSLAGGTFPVTGASGGESAIFAGGRSASDFYGDVERYDGALTRSLADPLDSGRASLSCGTIGNYLLFAGGINSSYKVVTTVDVYDTSLTKSLAMLSNGRTDMASAAGGQYCFFIHGQNDYNLVDIIDSFNSSLTKNFLYAGRPTSQLEATNIGDCVLFGGGKTSSGTTSEVVVIDSSLTYETVTPLTNVKASLAAATVSEHAIFGGGVNETGSVDTTEYFASADAYDGSYTRTQISPLTQAKANLKAVSNGGYAIFGPGSVNGQGIPSYSDQLDVYDTTLVKQQSVSTGLARVAYGFANAGTYSILAGGSYSLGAGTIYTNVAEAYTAE